MPIRKTGRLTMLPLRQERLNRRWLSIKLSIAAPLMDASGSAQIPKEEGGPLSLKLDVQEVHSQVRSELTPLLGFFGQSIPEGAFTFEFDWQGSGMPAMILR